MTTGSAVVFGRVLALAFTLWNDRGRELAVWMGFLGCNWKGWICTWMESGTCAGHYLSCGVIIGDIRLTS